MFSKADFSGNAHQMSPLIEKGNARKKAIVS